MENQLLKSLSDLVGMLEAHKIESLSCVDDGNTFCKCLPEKIRAAKSAIAELKSSNASFDDFFRALSDFNDNLPILGTINCDVQRWKYEHNSREWIQYSCSWQADRQPCFIAVGDAPEKAIEGLRRQLAEHFERIGVTT